MLDYVRRWYILDEALGCLYRDVIERSCGKGRMIMTITIYDKQVCNKISKDSLNLMLLAQVSGLHIFFNVRIFQ